jgi:hypothetical protein
VTRIDVQRADPALVLATFVVTVTDDDGSTTTHEVRIDPDAVRIAECFSSPRAFVLACFGFLLEREPKESILRSFDASAIGRYFPNWQEELGGP